MLASTDVRRQTIRTQLPLAVSALHRQPLHGRNNTLQVERNSGLGCIRLEKIFESSS